MTAIVNKKINESSQQTLGKTKNKINWVKKYPYWVYIILGLGLAGLIVAIATTVLVSNIYWAYSNYYFNVLDANGQFSTLVGKELGPNDFWKLILINPELFNINGKFANYSEFNNWCKSHNVLPFLDSEQYEAFSYFFGVWDSSSVAPTQFNQQIANQLWNPNANAYYITTCVFWIASVITLSIILFNWWAYVVKQIKANELPKEERIAAKKAKKEARLLLKQRKAKIKELKARNEFKKEQVNISTTCSNISSVSVSIPKNNNVSTNTNENSNINDATNVIKFQARLVKSAIKSKEE